MSFSQYRSWFLTKPTGCFVPNAWPRHVKHRGTAQSFRNYSSVPSNRIDKCRSCTYAPSWYPVWKHGFDQCAVCRYNLTPDAVVMQIFVTVNHISYIAVASHEHHRGSSHRSSDWLFNGLFRPTGCEGNQPPLVWIPITNGPVMR